MSRLKARLFIGQTEPGIYQISDRASHESLSRIVAITNAMWMQQHARGAGAIFRGTVIYPMVPGMATLVLYNDDSVDILVITKDVWAAAFDIKINDRNYVFKPSFEGWGS